MKSKFDDLYKVIMEGKFYDSTWNNRNDIADVRNQQLSYDQSQFGQEVKLIGMMNGEPILDQEGNPLEWEVNAQDGAAVDLVTGQKIPKYHTSFLLRRGPRRRDGMHVAVQTYEDVYYNQDSPLYQNPEYMQKLHDLGLIPGFHLSY